MKLQCTPRFCPFYYQHSSLVPLTIILDLNMFDAAFSAALIHYYYYYFLIQLIFTYKKGYIITLTMNG